MQQMYDTEVNLATGNVKEILRSIRKLFGSATTMALWKGTLSHAERNVKGGKVAKIALRAQDMNPADRESITVAVARRGEFVIIAFSPGVEHMISKATVH